MLALSFCSTQDSNGSNMSGPGNSDTFASQHAMWPQGFDNYFRNTGQYNRLLPSQQDCLDKIENELNCLSTQSIDSNFAARETLKEAFRLYRGGKEEASVMQCNKFWNEGPPVLRAVAAAFSALVNSKLEDKSISKEQLDLMNDLSGSMRNDGDLDDAMVIQSLEGWLRAKLGLN